MSTLRLAIDASGMRAGAAQATQALTSVSTAATQTGRAIDNAVTGISGGGRQSPYRRIAEDAKAAAQSHDGLNRSTIRTASAALQVGHNLNLMSQQIRFSDGSLASLHTTGLIAASGLLDLAHIMHSTEVAGGAATTVFGKFINVLKAHPILAAVVALGAISTAISLFAHESEAAKTATEGLNKAIEESNKLRFERQFGEKISRPVGIDLASQKAEIDRLQALALSLKDVEPGDVLINMRDAAEALNLSLKDTLRLLEESGITIKTRNVPGVESILSGTLYGERPQEMVTDAQGLRIALGNQAGKIAKTIPQERKPLDEFLEDMRRETALLRQQDDEREKSVALRQAELLAEQQHKTFSEDIQNNIRSEIALQQQLIELRQLGQDTFAAVGQGLFAAATGATSFRSALAGVLQQLIAIGQSQFVQRFANFGGQLFANTATQNSSPGFNQAASDQLG